MFGLCLILCLCALQRSSCHTIHETDRLFRYLFDDSRYNKHLRPSVNQSISTQVDFSISLSELEDLDIATGNTVVSCYIQTTWLDELLVWNVTEFGGITEMKLPDDFNWDPDLLVVSGKSRNGQSFLLSSTWVHNQGMVSMVLSGIIETKCHIDTSWFPFDSHECILVVISDGYDITDVILNLRSDTVYTQEMSENPEWLLESTSVHVHNITSDDTPIVISSVVCKFTLKRRPTFLLLHGFLPLFLLLSLSVVSSYVPVDSGERLSFAASVYLSFAVMSGALLDELPRNSIKISQSSYVMLAGNITSTIGVLWSVLIVRLSKRADDKIVVPQLLKNITLALKRKTSAKTACRLTGTRAASKVVDMKVNGNSVCDVCDVCDFTDGEAGHNSGKADAMHDNDNLTWIEVAETLDRIYFALSLLSTMSVFIFYFVTVVGASRLIPQ